MNLAAAFNAATHTVLAALLYLILHEAAHYAASMLAGCSASLKRSTDGLVASPGLSVTCGGHSQIRIAIILYAPYVVNLFLLFLSRWPALRLIALLTLPNALLEESRGPLRVGAAVALAGVLAVLAAG